MDTPTKTVFDVVTDFLASKPSDEEVLAYHIPPDLQARLDALVEIKTTSRLTAAQREELGDFRFAGDVMTRLKAKIKLRLKQKDSNDCGAASAVSDGGAASADAAETEEKGS